MRLGIMQSYFFPYIGYFQLIDAADTFCIYEHVSFRKKSWITRNRILNRGSLKPVFISVPVKGKSSFKTINEVDLIDSDSWKKALLKNLYFNYKKAKCFDDAFGFIETLINIESYNIHDYNSKIITRLSEWLGCTTTIVSHSDRMIELELEANPLKGILDIKTTRVLKICQKFDSKHYINPVGGVELYDKTEFKDNGVQLSFIKSNKIVYRQWENECVQNLSIIDMMMHLPKTEIQQFLKSYSLN